MFSKKIYTTLLALCLVFSLSAQKEQNNWFFGLFSALTWNTTRSYTATGMFGATDITLTGIPTFVAGSPMSTHEGCFSLSDSDGNLLFFSDGSTIWNRNKVVMTNGSGLTGNSSSAQSGIIFAYPGSSTRFIALTLGELNANNLSYSIVDMTQSSGLGAVEAANKNILFTGQSGLLGESVTAVRHTNMKDFWVVAVGRGATTYFNVWKVSQSGGVQTTLHSVASVAQTSLATIPAGYIKFAKGGKAFIWISYNENFFVIGDFDPSTGMLSNLKVRSGGGGTSRGYGVEFSPDGRYLYLTYTPGQASSTIAYPSRVDIYDYQNLMSAANPNTITPVRTFSLGPSFSDGTADLFSGIQLGPDNRMYISDFNTSSLFVIPDPNNPITANLYKLTGLLGTRNVRFGLPSFSEAWFKMKITPPSAAACAEYTQNYTLTVGNGIGFSDVAKIVIDFGDNRANSQVTVNNPPIGSAIYPYRYKTPGTYNIILTAYNAANEELITETSPVQINTCALKVNKHIRGINK